MIVRITPPVAVLLAVLLGPVPDAGPQAGPDPASVERARGAIRPDAIRAHMRFLSDGALEGREPGTRGYDIAAKYVAAALEALGLQPAGAGGSWFQQVPLRRTEVLTASSSLTLRGRGVDRTLVADEDYVLLGQDLHDDVSVRGDLVYVGFGVSAPELEYDDYAGVDVDGKVVVALDGAPPRFPATERAYHADFALKQRNAVAHGAVGFLALFPPETQERLPWEWLLPQVKAGSMHWLDADGRPNDAVAGLRGVALLNRSGADAVFAGAPTSLDQALAAGRKSASRPIALPFTAEVHTVSRHTALESPNIAAVLRGSDPALRDQHVVYTAHVDHLGACPAVDGDTVCHGAFDNASGVAVLLEVARAYAALPRPPRRSVAFLFVTGEEWGLLGSGYFAHYPTVPLDAIVANINIDGAPGLLFPIKDVVALGAQHSTLGQDVASAAAQLGVELSPDPYPEEGFFIRSDQYSFVKRGVPSVALLWGVKTTDPDLDAGAIVKAMLTRLYHTPRDNMSQSFHFDSAAAGARLVFLAGYTVAQRDARPAWNPGDFFGTTFARTAGVR